MGRCVYEGIYDPADSHADIHGFRSDVARLVRELGIGVVRYPGGNFASGYDWRETVGPVADRPSRLDLAWRALEPNTFGLGEFMDWARLVGVEPMMTVNLGTGDVADAVDLVEYTNTPAGTRYSDLRRSHGAGRPYGIKLWCLGNEMDGPWQIGHKSADEYGSLAARTATAMRRVDPSIELVACGSSHDRMPTFGRWEAAVLERAYDEVDYLSLHCYYGKSDDDTVGYLASADAMDVFIDRVVATCDHIATLKHSTRRLKLSFDEWNVETRVTEAHPPWTLAPRMSEDEFTAEDAVVVGGLLVCLLRHSDRVAVACLAQLVNVMAPIRTERGHDAWRQPTFYPFALTARHARGDVLRVEPRSSTLVSSVARGDVEPVDLVATHDGETGETVVFAVNRSTRDSVELDLELTRGATAVGEHATIRHDGAGTLRASQEHQLDGRHLRAVAPPGSWSMLRLA